MKDKYRVGNILTDDGFGIHKYIIQKRYWFIWLRYGIRDYTFKSDAQKYVNQLNKPNHTA